MSVIPDGGSDPHVGRVIDGRYRIVRRLGEGGMGIVFEAEHVQLGKRVALKIVAPERLGEPELAARFTREARATAQIEHPHIASGFDYGLLPEGGAFLVAQLVRGGSLRERIDGGPTPWPEACGIAAQIADALTAIHRAGYVHRDLTPENVLIAHRDDGRAHVYVLDFGVAALTAASADPARYATVLTEAGTVVGTNGYMAPEQALGRAVDARADLYVLGVLLWEMIAGARLFATSSSMTEIVSAQLASAHGVVPASSSGSPLPFDLERLLRDLLSPDATRRPASASELRAMLIRIAAGQPARELEAPPAGPSPEVERAAQAMRSWALQARAAAASRHGAIAIGSGLAIGALATVIAVVIAITSRPDAPPVEVATPEPVVAPVPLPVALDPPDDRVARMASALHRERESAAQEVLADASPSTPTYARALAELVVANTCDERARALASVRDAGDPRAAPVIERLAAAPRRGCGRRGRSDCYACIRGELDTTLAALRSPASP